MADPMYMRIANDLRAKINSGELSPGDQLHTEEQLRADYSRRPEFSSGNVSRNTVRDAVSVLVNERLVEKRPGSGTFVIEKVDPFITTLSGNPGGGETQAYASEVERSGHKRVESEPVVGIRWSSEAPELELGEGAQVISRHQERFIDGKPYSLQTSFYPRDFVNRGAVRLGNAGAIEGGAVAYIRETLHIKQLGWRDKLRIRAADAFESDFFDLPAKGGGQVIEARRTGYDEGGRPFRLTVTIYATDRNHLVYEGGKVPKVTPTSYAEGAGTS